MLHVADVRRNLKEIFGSLSVACSRCPQKSPGKSLVVTQIKAVLAMVLSERNTTFSTFSRGPADLVQVACYSNG